MSVMLVPWAAVLLWGITSVFAVEGKWWWSVTEEEGFFGGACLNVVLVQTWLKDIDACLFSPKWRRHQLTCVPLDILGRVTVQVCDLFADVSTQNTIRSL